MLAAALAVALASGVVAPAGASEPKSHTIKVTKEPGVRTYTWTGVVGPAPTGAVGAATDPCTGDPDIEDQHAIKLDLGSRVYKSVIVTFDFQINWSDSGQDLALSVTGPTGTVGTSDGGDPTESVSGINLDEGTYSVNACAFAAVGDTDYNGVLKVTTKERPAPKATTTTAKPPASGSGDSGSGSAPSGTAVTPSPTTPPASPSSPSRATPFNSPAFGGSFSTVPAAQPLVASDPVAAAPPAFLSSGLDPVEAAAAPPPAALRTKDTPGIPLALVLGSSALGLVGLVAALLLRRRRGLDQTPGGSAVVPVI